MQLATAERLSSCLVIVAHDTVPSHYHKAAGYDSGSRPLPVATIIRQLFMIVARAPSL